MNTPSLDLEALRKWIKDNPKRREILKERTPIAESTLQGVLLGRYNPSQRMIRSINDVLRELSDKSLRGATKP